MSCFKYTIASHNSTTRGLMGDGGGGGVGGGEWEKWVNLKIYNTVVPFRCQKLLNNHAIS
jgi:hypothetical protein